MSDLWTFYGVTVAAAGAINLNTQRMQQGDVVALIELDMGMCAKIWSLQLEGTNIGKVVLQYMTDGVNWNDFKGFNKDTAVAERWKFTARPLVIEAWNNTTFIRVLEEAGGGADIEISVDIEFDDIHKQ